ncbi:RHS repeat-associated core domain-containing protein [Chryseobacterium culicis]|uniref:RHS repeat-associated core domain-containing protein n=1 Tax=Chryseobacterium culicis TaxID=680127 RepID=A0A1H6HK76_CHRCI|nr:RHS repeat-associated core domain-containing protein [Chryseobacterium culicis]SEH34685.1 RHS repeat-associated core domain-containing protein [Chryseobacterium culicis]
MKLYDKKIKLFSAFILSLWSVLSLSQTILYQTETISRTVQDPQTVVMAQGFHAKADISNPFIAKIGTATENPGGGPTDSNAGANNPSGTTAPDGKSFHDTKGNIEVNGAGQLQFTLPIALPPGVKSVAPQVNLIYTSGTGNSIAGYGWNLSGITSISRAGKTIDKDAEAKGVQLDYTDRYSFNGQRLILRSGEYGKDGAEYVTEKYSNIKIKSVGSINGQAWQGPEFWEVTFEDGSQAWYGATTSGLSSARTPIEYNIVKWKDNKGNYITYDYLQTGVSNVAIISSIQWGGNEMLNKPNFNKIDFIYINRSLAEDSYVGGIRFLQTQLLSEIKVMSSGNPFKRYAINYLKNGTNYEIVDNIIEYNADSNTNNNFANPASFTYPTPTQPVLEFSNNNVDSFENVKLTGDFNGDGYLDFSLNNGVVKLGGLNNTFTDISPGKTFNTEAKVVNTLLDEEGQVYNGNGIVQYEGGKLVGYIFRNSVFVKVFEKLVYDETDCTAENQPPPAGCHVEQPSLNEGDINGDGISDIFLTLKKEICQWVYDPNCANKTSNDTANRPPPCSMLECNTYTIASFIVDLKNANNPLSTYTLDSGINESSYYKQQYLDIDGDRKVDIINVSNTAYTVFEFIKTAPNQYLKKIKFTGNLAETKAPEFTVLFGDFNGDGNLDFTIPTTDNKEKDNWRFYMGTGKEFSNILKTDFLKYRKPDDYQNSNYPTFNIYRNFYTSSDINKDGKSDIVHINSFNKAGQVNSSGVILNRYYGYTIASYTANGAMANGDPDFYTSYTYGGSNYVTGTSEFALFSPITTQVKVNNNYYDVLLFWKERMHKLKSSSPVGKLAQVQSITQGGIITSADYLEVIPNDPALPNFYQKVKKEYYPYFSLNRADQSYAVSQLRQEGRKQDFRYRGMTGHLQGKGMMGYHQSARSSWYADGFENTKIWSGVEIDPLFDGAPVKEWSIRTSNENNIFPTDISENNTQLLSFKSTLYESYKLLNGQIVSTPVSDTDKPRIVTATVPKSTKTKDFLIGTLSNSSIIYGDYYLPKQTVTNVNNGYAVTTSDFEYIHNISAAGSDYFVGRPKSKTETLQAYGDTKSAKEEYVYENNLLKTLKTWNRDNTGYLLETYNYDGFGNIIQKTINNSVDSQTQTNATLYDPQGRFVIKKTDNLGLETGIEYNDWGQIKKQTDALGNTLVNTYDAWGKLLTSKTNLEGTTTYQYNRDSDSNITVTQYDSDGDISKKYTNKLGQEYKVSTKAFGQGQFVSQETGYDVLGRKIKESEPYFEGLSPSQFNTIVYDDTVFPAKITATSFNGKKIETSVSGLTSTVKELNGYGRTTSKTTDALGNVSSSTDKGGTIQFTYNAAGEQIKAQYAENIVTTKYDSWGRKSEFNDPSNGIYKYEYDSFGQPRKTISPKGTKEFIYNNLGQLISQKELSTTDAGQATNKLISYSYDNKGRLVSKSGTSKGQPYSFNVSYDPQGRLLSSSESSNGKYFIQKGITYDDKARVISYEKQLYSSGVLTKVQIENVYSAWNGELYQIKDKSAGKILWELKEINAKGQVLKSRLGATDVNNTYDTSGFLTNVNHSSQVKPSILQLSYSFDAIRNELKSRTTGGDFNINESFDYDDNNRLVNWTNPVTGVKPQTNRNVYDIKGRITQNDQIGTIKFENSAKIYQATGMTLNAAGEQNYNNDLIQSITYNENNDPVFIDGMKGDAAFQYGLTSMRQRVTYGGNFSSDSDGKFTKFYSEDGSFEVVKDNTTGKEKHILYIGGNPYESNIVYLKNFAESSGSYKFLHKDYIGSILAISDEAGNKLEQRHFDAWGNFTHLQIGNGTIVTDKNIIDDASLLLERGYTSHEHFSEVGIIHMNGRLYDPLLRRFLNADENIQDPYNTQNYNKYGYVLNNPLMFNDPSGEFWVAGFFLTYLAPIIWGVAVGTLISAGMYAIQALVMNSWSWNGFANALLMGAVTGGVSGGLGQVFSASGFWGSVGSSAFTGAGTGGVTALLTGQNFLEGVIKGAVIGGAVAGISYYGAKFFSTPNDYQGQTVDVLDTESERIYGTPVEHSSDQVLKVINKEYKGALPTNASVLALHDADDLPQYLKDKGYTFDGTVLRNGDKQEVLATTTPFYKNKYMRYVFAPNVSRSYQQLVKTTGHELLHGTFFSKGIGSFDMVIPNWGITAFPDELTNHHGVISVWEDKFLKYKGWQNLPINKLPLINLDRLMPASPGHIFQKDLMLKIMNNFFNKSK